jgi:hypothetical protein
MAIKTYAYNDTSKVSQHFAVSEFRCKCGKPHNIKISEENVNMLEKLYTKIKANKGVISSGYRCPTHDRAVGGSGYGPHCDGYAVDIIFYDKNNKPINTKLISCVAQDLGFNGIANITYNYDYIHLDMKGRIYKGNEIGGNYNTVTTDFYKYYNITKEQIMELTKDTTVISNNTSSTSNTDKVNNKDKSTKSFVFSNKYDSMIKELQQVFVSKGYTIAIDGYAGMNTYNVCKKFTVEKGDKGPLVCWVQRRLNYLGFNCGIADGIAGNGTMNAIKKFQKANGLGQGYLGGTDWYCLIK